MFYEKAYGVMKEKKLDAILVSDGANMRYLSGFRGATGYLYLSQNRRVLATDSRYTTMAKEEATDFEVLELPIGQSYGKLLDGLMKEDGVRNVGFENLTIRWNEYQKINQSCGGLLNVPLEESLDMLRCIKTEEEIGYIAKAEAIGDAAFTHMLGVLKTGMTELEAAAELEYFLKTHGAEDLSFDTIVASGVNSSMPHAMPGQKKIEAGDFVTMDFGCIYQGYCSDMTRTVVMGKATEKQKEIYRVVLEAQLAALEACKAGVPCNSVDKVARDIIAQAGYGAYFGHGLGHSVGLKIHENPRLSPAFDTILQPGMLETVEPGIYLPGFGGVRTEDLVVITKEGHRNLTHSTKELMEL